ncbi:hypothetical protein B0A54_14211 [Friedmanniomyces endolithicus]|uniref:Uncharacterized protein n=1 Tax=Friedmanniomyces endolithicus TaxID=329885 RepID=A0A4U0UH37_9PEZI|nr:hypothetical protein LTS09_012302 [Friedmanniomyces endolithicus]TKA33825.1 hypothetical protein B0A54_14211 [Friedmanniomyces endolithicus]
MAASSDDDPADDSSIHEEGGLTGTFPIVTETSLTRTPSVESTASGSDGASAWSPWRSEDMRKNEESSGELESQAIDSTASPGMPVSGHTIVAEVSHGGNPPPLKNTFPKSFQRFRVLPIASQYVRARAAAEAPKEAGTEGRKMQIFRKPGLKKSGASVLPKPPDQGA